VQLKGVDKYFVRFPCTKRRKLSLSARVWNHLICELQMKELFMMKAQTILHEIQRMSGYFSSWIAATAQRYWGSCR
jgi:hypothetical protein